MHLQRYFLSLFHIWFHFHSLSLVSVSLLLFKLCSFLFTFPLLKYNFLNIAATILFLQFHFSPIVHDFSSLCFTPAKFSLFSLFSGKAPRNAYSGLGPEGTQWTIRRTHFMHFWKLTNNLQITSYKQCHLICCKGTERHHPRSVFTNISFHFLAPDCSSVWLWPSLVFTVSQISKAGFSLCRRRCRCRWN